MWSAVVPPTALAGTTVSFNGIAAPLVYSPANEVGAIAPSLTHGTTAQVTLSYQGQTSPAVPLPVAACAPSLFTPNPAGWSQAAPTNTDGTLNTAGNPAKIGGYILLYATGEGEMAVFVPPVQTGIHPVLPGERDNRWSGGRRSVREPVGGGLTQGVMQVNVQVPDDVQPGAYVPVVLQAGERPSGSLCGSRYRQSDAEES
jgi:uncharacterized protein (TIGR03437 family)